MEEPGLQPVPRQLRAGPPRLLVRHAVQLRPGAGPAVRPVAGPGQATSRRRSCRTTRTPGPSSRPTSPTRRASRPRPPGRSTGRSTRAGRACCGTCTTATATRPAAYFGAQEANRSLHALYALDSQDVGGGQPDRLPAGRAVRWRPGCTAWPGGCWKTSGPGRSTLASQQVASNVLRPRVPRAPPRRAPGQRLLRRAAAARGTAPCWTTTSTGCPPSPTWSNWRRTLGNPQATMTSYANLRALNSLPGGGRPGPGGHLAAARAGRRRPGDQGDDHEHARPPRRPPCSCAPTSCAAPAAAACGRATASCSPRPGTATTSRCGPGESQTLTVSYDSASLRGASPVISLSGWNVAAATIAAPVP